MLTQPALRPSPAVDFGPLSRGSDILATRWTPVIVRNLLLGSETFSELLDASPGISRTLLTQRLRMLEHHAIVDRYASDRGRVTYRLAPAGHALAPVISALGAWSAAWVDRPPEHFVAEPTLRALCDDLDVETLGAEGRLVLRFDITSATHREQYWLLVHRGRTELCRRPLAGTDDFVVRADAAGLAAWQRGDLTLGQAVGARRMQTEGPRWIERALAQPRAGALAAR